MSAEAQPAAGAAQAAGGAVRLLVGGEWRTGGGTREVIDPSTGEPAGTVALATAADLDDALAAAQDAFPAWAATPGHDRGAVLKRAAALLAERAEDVAAGLTHEGGKLPAEAAAEVGRAIETLQWNGEEAGRIEGRIIQGRVAGAVRLSQPEPVGVVAAFTAWNFPAVLAARKLGAALAAGCTVILKAAEETPRTAAEVVRALHDAGAPVSLVFGDPPQVSEHVIQAPAVRAVTFTGSTAVGRIVAGRAAQGPKRCVLELGGHAPVIVARDADVDLAVRATLPAKFGSAGQSCVAPSRFYVHEDRYDEFATAFTAAAEQTQVGPVITATRLDAMQRLTADAVARGARVLTGGDRTSQAGYFFAPTVLADVPDDAQIATEEPFGPIAALAPFTDLDDVLARANGTAYAFAAYVFTDSTSTRDRLIAGLRASNIGVNQMAPSMPDAPLGGLQDSGYGYEGGRDGIHAFQHFRLISQTAG
jgi:succinate-semialdehyde dehydrogenase / glutarate-semialdehyde dehydrogenase